MPEQEQPKYWQDRGKSHNNYVYGTPLDYGVNESPYYYDRHPWSPGHGNAKIARVSATLEEVFHLLEQNHDFSYECFGIDPMLYKWQSKPHWKNGRVRDRLVNRIDAEFTHEFVSDRRVDSEGNVTYRPAYIWTYRGITQEPGFYRLDYWGRLALALRLDAALVPQPEDEQTRRSDSGPDAGWQ